MASSAVTESVVEDAARAWLAAIGYAVGFAAEIAVAGRNRLIPAQCHLGVRVLRCAPNGYPNRVDTRSC